MSTKIYIGETFLVHPVLFSDNIFFNEASVIKSGMFWHAPDTIFMGLHLVFGPQTVVKLITTCSKWNIWRPWQQLFAYLDSWVWFFCFITSDNTTLPLIHFQSAAFHGVSAVKMVENHVIMAWSFQRPLEPLFLSLVSIFRILLSRPSLKSIKKSSYARKNCRKFAKTLSVSGIPTCSNTFEWGKLT
jgi:hypothetical protein